MTEGVSLYLERADNPPREGKLGRIGNPSYEGTQVC